MKSKYTSILSKFALSYDLKGIFNLSKFFGSLGDIGISVVNIYNRLSNDLLFSLTPPPLQSPPLSLSHISKNYIIRSITIYNTIRLMSTYLYLRLQYDVVT